MIASLTGKLKSDADGRGWGQSGDVIESGVADQHLSFFCTGRGGPSVM